jgi:hypothetical protein
MSAEDKFALVEMEPTGDLFPHPFTFGNLGFAMNQLLGRWEFLWDFRKCGDVIFNDMIDAYEEAGAYMSRDVVVASPDHADAVRELALRNHQRCVQMKAKPLPRHDFDLSLFDDDEAFLIDYDRVISDSVQDYRDASGELGMIEEDGELIDQCCSELSNGIHQECEEDIIARLHDDEYSRLHDAIQKSRAVVLNEFLDSIGVNSLLTELAIVFREERVTVLPYHSFSVHKVPIKRDDLVLLRPGRESAAYWRRFQHAIAELEHLLTINASEYQLECLFRANPLFLRGLNYRKVYSQVVLPLEDGKSLRPDIIAEPIDSEWCHIIDLKRGFVNVTVGRDNRASLAAAIHEVAAQLREYSSYFDDRKAARYIEEKYGFKCYRPRLVAFVGRDPSGYSEEQMRRAMTAYPDLEIVTYDRLLRAARGYLLL